jgi:predicted histidine transporter YuiF (NhaC family)
LDRISSVGIVTLGAGRSGDRIPVRARFYTPVETGSGAHPVSYTVGIGSLSRW